MPDAAIADVSPPAVTLVGDTSDTAPDLSRPPAPLPPRPIPLPVQFDNVPNELQQQRQFVCWHFEYVEEKGKWDKIPLNPRDPYKNAKTNAESTWGTFGEARATYEAHRNTADPVDGIGFVLKEGGDYFAVDVDKCYDPRRGAFDATSGEIVRSIDSYSEISPSNTGVRVIGRGKLPPTGRRKGNVEMYDSGRFVTITGNHVPGTPKAIMDCQRQVHEVHRRFIGKAADPGERAAITPPAPPSPPARNLPTSRLTDEEVLHKLLNDKHGALHRHLHDGGLAHHPSDSEADLAYCNDLAFYSGGDPAQIDRLFRQSGRMRPKWDKRRSSDGRTYGQMTIARALDRTEFYTGRPSDDREGSEESPHADRALAHPRFTFLHPKDLLSRPRPRWRIEGVLVENTLALLAGAPAGFKSFNALGMACSIATGRPWHGRAVERGPVVYISAEGTSGLSNRLLAWSIANDADLFGEDSQLVILDSAVQFLIADEVAGLLDAIAALPASPVLIVIDTLARCLVNGEENSAKDMGVFVQGMEVVRRATGATVLALHHTNKVSGEPRGSTAITGAMDTIIMAHRTAGAPTVELRCSKMKDAEEFDTIYLSQKVVEVGDDETSLVFEEIAREKVTPITNATRVAALHILHTFGELGATSTEWEKACAEDKMSASTFARTRNVLQQHRLIEGGGTRGKKYRVSEAGRSLLLASGRSLGVRSN